MQQQSQIHRHSARLRRSARKGFTLVELLIAMGLLAILMTAVINLLDGTLRLWNRTELRRGLVEEGMGVLNLMGEDLRQADFTSRGDLLCDWVSFDTDADGGRDTFWPRLRIVRHASAAEFARLNPRPQLTASANVSSTVEHEGLLEVCYVVLPAYTPTQGKQDDRLRCEGLLWRGEHIVNGPGVSIFEPGFFTASNEPPADVMQEVAGGVLWAGFEFASQTTVLTRGWQVGGGLGDAGTSYDAWRKNRADTSITPLNLPTPGVVGSSGRALLPRRVRVTLEMERTGDRRRRTVLKRLITVRENLLEMEDPDRLPKEGSFIKLGSEWMQIIKITDNLVSVQRGQRGTLATAHEPGTFVHYGFVVQREFALRDASPDWGL